MKILDIEVKPRDTKGTLATNRLRAEGRIPAVLYGLARPNADLSVDAREMEAHLRRHQRVFKLKLGGEEQPSFLKEVQWDSTSDHPLHIDFQRIDLNKPLEVTVEVAFVGHPAGLSKGGQLIKDHAEVRLMSLPTAIPESIEVSVAKLEIGDRILAKELALPPTVTLNMPPETVICHVIVAQVAAPAAPPPTEAGAAEAAPAGEAAAKPAEAKSAEAKKPEKK
jgi:large subunit ribosomal protein L25